MTVSIILTKEACGATSFAMYATGLRVLFVLIALSNVSKAQTEIADDPITEEATQISEDKPSYYYLYVKQPRYVKALVKNINKIVGNDTRLDTSWYLRKIQKMGYILKIPVIPGKEIAFKKLLKGYKLPLMRMKKRRGYLSDQFVTPDDSLDSKSSDSDESGDDKSSKEFLDPDYYDYISEVRKPGQIRKVVHRKRKPKKNRSDDFEEPGLKKKKYRLKKIPGGQRNNWIQVSNDEDDPDFKTTRRGQKGTTKTVSYYETGDTTGLDFGTPSTPFLSDEEMEPGFGMAKKTTTLDESAEITTISPDDAISPDKPMNFRKFQTDSSFTTTTEAVIPEDADEPKYSLNDLVRLSNGIIRRNNLVLKGSCCKDDDGLSLHVGYSHILPVIDETREIDSA